MELGITRNSPLHKTLQLLNLAPKNMAEIKKHIDHKKSNEMFQKEVLNVLTNGGMIVRKSYDFNITPFGEQELKRLGVSIKRKPKPQKSPAYTYERLTIKQPPVRPGADDHMMHPSRRGDRLFYLDGRVGAV